ncbi:MAG: class I SAM-dependent methyltransferase [Planctomycetes bacterium]|nr:class I SAM-dependent methyltransferase [Planctomycetota bacterium]
MQKTVSERAVRPVQQPKASAAGKAAKSASAVARVEKGVVERAPQLTPSRKSSRNSRRKTGGKAQGFTAATADKYELYQKAVQSPELDIGFLRRVFKSTRGRDALHFREDFCGTGLLSATWLAESPAGATAEGFDLDPEPVAWGLAHHFDDLGEKSKAYTVHLKDVRAAGSRAYDVRVSQNFSHFVFTKRAEMLAYFESARESLVDDGVFVIDLYGGSDATEEMKEDTKFRGFTYVWEQDKFFPGTGEYTNHITFRFPDGTALERAFSYKWRMWYLTELADILLEAGFQRVERYFEGWNAKGTAGDGIFRKGSRGENCGSWIAYLVGVK